MGRLETEQAMRRIKVGRRGSKCTVRWCTNTMGGDSGYPCQGDHLLSRGQFPELEDVEYNIRPTCGCHNDIEKLNLYDRLLYIKKAWPDRFKWCVERAKRRLHPDDYKELMEMCRDDHD